LPENRDPVIILLTKLIISVPAIYVHVKRKAFGLATTSFHRSWAPMVDWI